MARRLRSSMSISGFQHHFGTCPHRTGTKRRDFDCWPGRDDRLFCHPWHHDLVRRGNCVGERRSQSEFHHPNFIMPDDRMRTFARRLHWLTFHCWRRRSNRPRVRPSISSNLVLPDGFSSAENAVFALISVGFQTLFMRCRAPAGPSSCGSKLASYRSCSW
jgi:hypothetical protein